ncbi:FKBP-type peptidyl-prolyl cis-trans isomerase [Nocardioides sp. BP30]|uniref:FKBP-type peptidyl-prolyl cis-trans isomerase n=1 Tax=Nocardioides sp. BP30 TaxID=3036374 RepID=UPI00246850F6|nr:FKBP-type peptidyl-prolyl cis-trans isomerase [Nocardioides sp. BP30]WGL50768.1 FKBP-type peptidyl-prolyl cis-trans isomerase [Nocardioides sp. BP30]
MLRRLHRPAAAALLPLLLVPALAACGGGSNKDDAKSTASASASTGPSTGITGVSFTGDVGKSVTATWKSTIAMPSTTTVKTLVKGTGDTIAANDSVSAYLWIGDGTTKKTAYSDYQQGAAESLPNNGQLGTVFDKLFSGQTYGSRVVAVTNATDLLGSATAGSQLGIGAKDSVVVVADLVKKAPTSPTPSDAKVHTAKPGSQPTVVLKKGVVSGLNWKGVKKPSLTTPVQRVILKQGKGAKVKASDTVTVNYLGETYKATKPFDESYSTGKKLSTQLDQLIKGWAIGLDGVKVGSRVLLQIPPADAYGATAQTNIPANSTLWFVIDVVKAK